VADGDGGVRVRQQHGDWLADDVAASYNHGFLPGDFDAGAREDLHAAGGGARHQAGALRGEVADVHGMEAIHIFFRRDFEQHALGIDLLGERKLDEDAVNVVARVEFVDERDHLRGGDRLWRRDLLAVDAELLAGLDLVAHVDLGGGVVAHEHGGEAGTEALRGEGAHLGADFIFDLRGDLGAVEKGRGHGDL
jgi:hypothetical protein